MAVEGWKEATLGEFVTLQRGHDLPEGRRQPGSVPILGSFGITGFHNEAKTKGPGVTVGRSGASFGVVNYSPVDFWPLNTALYVTDFHGNDPRFAYYFLHQFDFKRYNSGSAQPSLNRNFIHPIQVAVPPLSEQRAIAHVLGVLDDKIELNERVNETLGAISRALFKSWFVNFDPVLAKTEGREPGLPPLLADLFPDSLTESEVGSTPTGWRVEDLGDVIELAYGKALKEDTRKPGTVAVYGSNGLVGWHNEKLADGPGIIVGRKGNPGVVTWAPTDFFAIDTTFYVVPKGNCNSLYFLFYALKDHNLASLGADSAVPGLNRNMAYMSKQLLPPEAVLDAFDLRVRPIFDHIQKNSEQSATLAGLREALLPMLISGKLRLANTERISGGQV